MSHPPVVLCCSGHDPTGGAGLQADIETLRALGCHPATVITALTAQDTRNVLRVYPQDPERCLTQARLVMPDLPIAVIKIGLLGSAAKAEAVARLAGEAGAVPVVLDPVLAAGGGQALATALLQQVIVRQLMPRVTVVTPNTPEARSLTGQTELDACAAALLAAGCPNVLLTGTHEEDTPEVINRWYDAAGRTDSAWPRLPGSYHGSGCTLAAAVAGGLAQGLPMAKAIAEAQRYTWIALREAYAAGRGQWLPRRLPPDGRKPP